VTAPVGRGDQIIMNPWLHVQGDNLLIFWVVYLRSVPTDAREYAMPTAALLGQAGVSSVECAACSSFPLRSFLSLHRNRIEGLRQPAPSTTGSQLLLLLLLQLCLLRPSTIHSQLLVSHSLSVYCRLVITSPVRNGVRERDAIIAIGLALA
jgi:hypothetical protein